MRDLQLILLIVAVGTASLVSSVGLAIERERVSALSAAIASLRGSVLALGGEVGAVAEVASGAASSAASLASNLAASTKEQGAAIRSQAAQLKSQSSALEDAVAKVNPAVVSITERDSAGNRLASGTGFVVRSSGYIVTNRHVVEDEEGSYFAAFPAGKEKAVTVVWVSPTDDLAIVKITGSGYPTVPLGDSGTLALGEQVFAIGNALGRFDNTVSVGVVSGLNRSLNATDAASGEVIALSGVIQTDAAINPGNSGGPVADLTGSAVGISTATARGSQSVGFAIPINRVKAALTAQGI